MTQSKDNDDAVSREEFEVVQDQVGHLTEEITELKQQLKEAIDRIDRLEGREDDRRE